VRGDSWSTAFYRFPIQQRIRRFVVAAEQAQVTRLPSSKWELRDYLSNLPAWELCWFSRCLTSGQAVRGAAADVSKQVSRGQSRVATTEALPKAAFLPES